MRGLVGLAQQAAADVVREQGGVAQGQDHGHLDHLGLPELEQRRSRADLLASLHGDVRDLAGEGRPDRGPLLSQAGVLEGDLGLAHPRGGGLDLGGQHGLQGLDVDQGVLGAQGADPRHLQVAVGADSVAAQSLDARQLVALEQQLAPTDVDPRGEVRHLGAQARLLGVRGVELGGHARQVVLEVDGVDLHGHVSGGQEHAVVQGVVDGQRLPADAGCHRDRAARPRAAQSHHLRLDLARPDGVDLHAHAGYLHLLLGRTRTRGDHSAHQREGAQQDPGTGQDHPRPANLHMCGLGELHVLDQVAHGASLSSRFVGATAAGGAGPQSRPRRNTETM